MAGSLRGLTNRINIKAAKDGKFKCQICKKLFKISNRNRNKDKIINSDLNLLLTNLKQIKEDYIEKNVVRIFCKVCKKTDKYNDHLKNFPEHNEKQFHVLNDFKKFSANIKVIIINGKNTNNSINNTNESSLTLYNRIGDLLDKFILRTNTNTDNNYYNNYDDIILRNNNLYNQLNLFYNLKDNTITDIIESNFENNNISNEIANNLNNEINTVNLLRNYQILKSNVMKYLNLHKQKTILLKSLANNSKEKIIYNDILYKSINNFYFAVNKNLHIYEKRFSISRSGDNIFLLDLRTKNVTQIPYKSIFKNFKSKRRYLEGQAYDISNNFSNNVQIDETGQFLFIVGKTSLSKKFRMYDLFNKEIKKLANLSIKMRSTRTFSLYYKKYLYVFMTNNNNNSHRLNIETDIWEELPRFNGDQYRISTNVINDKIYLFTGRKACYNERGNYMLEYLDLNKLNNENNNNNNDNNINHLTSQVNQNQGWQIIHLKRFNNQISYFYSFFKSDQEFMLLGEDKDNHYKGYLIDLESNCMKKEYMFKIANLGSEIEHIIKFRNNIAFAIPYYDDVPNKFKIFDVEDFCN